MDKAGRWMHARVQRASMKRKKALTDEAIKAGLRMTQEDLDRLDEIARKPGRNALTQLAALKLKMAATVAPARVEVGVEQSVTVVVRSMGRVVGVPVASLPVGEASLADGGQE